MEGGRLEPTRSCIRLLCETEHHPQKLWIPLADEESVIHKALKRGDCSTIFCRGGTNDRNGRKLLVEEVGWLGHDQGGLQGVAFQGLRIGLSLGVSESCKGDRCARSTRSIIHVGQRKRVACLVLPGLKVHGLAGAN